VQDKARKGSRLRKTAIQESGRRPSKKPGEHPGLWESRSVTTDNQAGSTILSEESMVLIETETKNLPLGMRWRARARSERKSSVLSKRGRRTSSVHDNEAGGKKYSRARNSRGRWSIDAAVKTVGHLSAGVRDEKPPTTWQASRPGAVFWQGSSGGGARLHSGSQTLKLNISTKGLKGTGKWDNLGISRRGTSSAPEARAYGNGYKKDETVGRRHTRPVLLPLSGPPEEGSRLFLGTRQHKGRNETEHSRLCDMKNGKTGALLAMFHRYVEKRNKKPPSSGDKLTRWAKFNRGPRNHVKGKGQLSKAREGE